MLFVLALLLIVFVRAGVGAPAFRVLRLFVGAAVPMISHAAIGCEVEATRRVLFQASMSATS